MKSKFIKVLPLAVAVLFATSCSKDDSNDEVVANPVQQEVKQEKKTITVTGKLSTKSSLSKFGVSGDENDFTFDGTETITMKTDDESFDFISVSAPKEDGTFTFEVEGFFSEETATPIVIPNVSVKVEGTKAYLFEDNGGIYIGPFEDVCQAIIASESGITVTITEVVTPAAPTEPTYTFSCGEIDLKPQVAIIKNETPNAMKMHCSISDEDDFPSDSEATEVQPQEAIAVAIDWGYLVYIKKDGDTGWGKGKWLRRPSDARIYVVVVE